MRARPRALGAHLELALLGTSILSLVISAASASVFFAGANYTLFTALTTIVSRSAIRRRMRRGVRSARLRRALAGPRRRRHQRRGDRRSDHVPGRPKMLPPHTGAGAYMGHPLTAHLLVTRPVPPSAAGRARRARRASLRAMRTCHLSGSRSRNGLRRSGCCERTIGNDRGPRRITR